MALPDRRVHARVSLDQGGRAAPADPPGDAELPEGLQAARGSRARVRPPQHQWALDPLRVRHIERVRLHADLTILTKLSCALVRARAASLAA